MLAVLLFSIFAWSALLTPAYFFGAHDAPHSIFFLVEFDQTLRDGYALAAVGARFRLRLRLPAVQHLRSAGLLRRRVAAPVSGFTFVGAIKAMYALATIGGGLAMYGLLARTAGHSRPA